MSEDKEKVQIYDDGTNSFKLLYHELADVKDVIVHNMKDDLVETFTKADNKIKSYLHYTNEDLTQENEHLRKQVQKLEELGFVNKIVLAYEGMDNKTVDQRYHELPGDAEDCDICKEGKDKSDERPYIRSYDKNEDEDVPIKSNKASRSRISVQDVQEKSD